MAKRFTDSRKWDDEWYLNLHKDHKLLWVYLLDKCDHAGFFKPNMKMLNFCLDATYKEKDILNIFKDRIKVVTNAKWFIPKFILFQYGELSKDSHFHKKIITTLKENRVSIPYQQGINTLKDKDMDKVMDKERDKGVYKRPVRELIHNTANKLKKG